jgi:hypothetical protein
MSHPRRPPRRAVMSFALIVAAAASAASAKPTQEEFFRSLTQNMTQEPDYQRLIPWAFAIAGVVVAIAYLSQRQKRQALPKPLNHQGKLVKEMIRTAGLDPAEIKRLGGLAQRLDCQSPLTLLLCPSLLAPAAPPTEPPATAEPDRNTP